MENALKIIENYTRKNLIVNDEKRRIVLVTPIEIFITFFDLLFRNLSIKKIISLSFKKLKNVKVLINLTQYDTFRSK